MAKSTVFITGATGFIGAQVTASALRAGYNVKLSVRRETQIDGLRQAFSSYPSALDFCVVPDYTTPEAFGTVLQGVDYVIHVASPLPNGNEDLLTPAVKGTTSILEAALKVKGIRKVVVTASVASLVPLDKYVDGTVVTGNLLSPSLIQKPLLINPHRKHLSTRTRIRSIHHSHPGPRPPIPRQQNSILPRHSRFHLHQKASLLSRYLTSRLRLRPQHPSNLCLSNFWNK